MEYKYKWITFDISGNSNEIESDGLSSYTFNFPEKYRDNVEELLYEYVSDSRLDIEVTEGNGFIRLNLWHTDCYIILVRYILDLKLKGVHINVDSTYFWFLHDLSHIENDVSGPTIYVNSYSELRAFKDIYKYKRRDVFKRLNVIPDTPVLYDIYKAFASRFKGDETIAELHKLFKLEQYEEWY